METVDLGQVEHTQNKMELLMQQVFAYQHGASASGSLGKVVGHNQYKAVVDDQFGNVVFHNLQSPVAQIIGKLDIDQNQFELVNQVQTGVGTVGIEVVEIATATVVEPTVATQ